MKKQLKILMSGGGTGGHIFPAIAIAHELKRRVPNAEILFVGAKDKMEMQKVPAAGYEIKGLWISGFHRSLDSRNLLFPIKLIASFFQANRIVKKFKPDVAVGTGGFASGPALNAASRSAVPIVIQEQNSFPGITNKLLSKRAKKICVAYDGMEKYFPSEKIIKTGNPVRQSIVLSSVKKERARIDFDLDIEAKVIFIVGGSLGSRTLNQCMIANLSMFKAHNVHVIWQTGAFMYEACKQASKHAEHLHVFDFITNIDHAYAAADIIISRAGAIAISELCIIGKPIILVPFPAASEDHQTKNAMALVNQNAALHIKDDDAIKDLIPCALDLIQSAEQQKILSENIKKCAITNAAERIVDEILKLPSL